MKKTPRDIIILHMCTKNYDEIDDVQFLRYGAQRTDRWYQNLDDMTVPEILSKTYWNW